MYDDVVREPVPEEFLRLLEEAEKAEEAAETDDGAREGTDVG
jgi:hypothetical protein